MKKFLILLIIICCCGCKNDIPKTRERAFITKTNFRGYVEERVEVYHLEYDGHEYIAFKQWNGTFGGVVHNPDCPCKIK